MDEQGMTDLLKDVRSGNWELGHSTVVNLLGYNGGPKPLAKIIREIGAFGHSHGFMLLANGAKIEIDFSNLPGMRALINKKVRSRRVQRKRKRRMRSNPSSVLAPEEISREERKLEKKAMGHFKKWHHKPAQRIEEVMIEEIPDISKIKKVGKILRTDYLSDKKADDDDVTYYYHDSNEADPSQDNSPVLGIYKEEYYCIGVQPSPTEGIITNLNYDLDSLNKDVLYGVFLGNLAKLWVEGFNGNCYVFVFDEYTMNTAEIKDMIESELDSERNPFGNIGIDELEIVTHKDRRYELLSDEHGKYLYFIRR